MRHSFCMGVVLTAVGAIGLLTGCRQETDAKDYKVVEGTAESIDVANNTATILWWNTRTQKHETREGKVTNETEIIINGKEARLEDIDRGETVKVTGKILKEPGGTPIFVADRIEVTRTSHPASAGAATTRPAGDDSPTP